MHELALWLLWPAASVTQLGAGAFARGEFAAAEQLFLMAWQARPHANIASNLAATARRRGNWPVAERWFTEVIERRALALGTSHADTAMAWNNRGETRLRMGRYGEAREDFKLALTLSHVDSDSAVMLHNLGDLERSVGRFTEARQALEESLRRRPGAAATSTLLALVLAELGERALDRARLPEAMRLCRSAMALAPTLDRAVRCERRVSALAVDFH